MQKLHVYVDIIMHLFCLNKNRYTKKKNVIIKNNVAMCNRGKIIALDRCIDESCHP